MIGLVLPWALVAACAAAGAWAYALVRQERAAYRGRVLSDRGLYEAGEAAATERKKPKLPRLARALHEAGVETPAANWAAGVAAIAFVSLSLAAALTGDPGIGAVVGAAALATAGVRLHVRRLRRRELLDRQLARALPQIAASVRSSLTLERALRTAASHVEDPLREELARVLADTAYGTTLATAFERMARRTDSPDVRSLAAAVRIQQRFGGAVAPVLDLIAAHAAAHVARTEDRACGHALGEMVRRARHAGDLFHHVHDECRLLAVLSGTAAWLDRAGCRGVLGGVRAVRLPAHHGDGSEPKVIAGGAGAAVCAMLVLGAIGGLAAYEAFVRYAAPARRDVVAPSAASASKDGHRAGGASRRRRATEAFGAFAAFLDKRVPLTRADVESSRDRLSRAGVELEPETWRSVRVVSALGCAGLAGVAAAGMGFEPPAFAGAAACCAACGWMAPSWALSRRERNRRRAIELALPDAMELLGIAIAAGSPIEQCFREVAESMDGPLAREFSLVDREVNLLGRSREEALEHLGQRCRSQDVSAFTAQLMQAVSQGSSLTEGLAVQAALARETAQAEAMERIRKMPTKLDIVLSLCFLPPTVALVVVPTVVNLLNFLNDSMG